MSSCCSGNCSCGPNCKCNGCTKCKMNADLGEEKTTTTRTTILGFASEKGYFDGFEIAESENGGCKCGSNCTCDPCNCK